MPAKPFRTAVKTKSAASTFALSALMVGVLATTLGYSIAAFVIIGMGSSKVTFKMAATAPTNANSNANANTNANATCHVVKEVVGSAANSVIACPTQITGAGTTCNAAALSTNSKISCPKACPIATMLGYTVTEYDCQYGWEWYDWLLAIGAAPAGTFYELIRYALNEADVWNQYVEVCTIKNKYRCD